MRTASHQFSPSGAMRSTRPMPSTCPCTKWPPRRAPTASGNSRLTIAPGALPAKAVRSRVSRERSAAKDFASCATTVRQHPFTAMLAPIERSCARLAARCLPGFGTLMVKRAPSSLRVRFSIFPRCSMIPVNIVKVSFDHKIRPETMQRKIRQQRNLFDRPRTTVRERNSKRAEHARSVKQNHFIHQIFIEHRAIERASRFENHTENFAAAEPTQNFAQLHASVSFACPNHLRAASAELPRFHGISRPQCEKENAAGSLCRVGNDFGAERNVQVRIQDDAQQRP